MKNKFFTAKKIIFVVFITFALGFATYRFLFKDRKHHDHSHYQHNANDKLYVCPMHPEITSNKKSTCPICGMDLVLASELEEEEDDGDGTDETEDRGDTSAGVSNSEKADMDIDKDTSASKVKLSLNRQQMIGIRTIFVEKKSLFKSIRAPGRVAFDPELYTAQSEYLEALKQWHRVKTSPVPDVKENSRQMIESSKIRLRVLGLSDEQIHRLTKRGSQSEGLLVSGKGQENWIYADVFEMDLPYIQKGLEAKITANFLKGEVLVGEVLSVDRVINPNTRTAKVRIQLNSSNVAIRPQSYVSVHILAPVGEHFAIPLESIMDTGRETYVFIKKGKNAFEPRLVQIILETESEAAIHKNIEIGEEVVVGGNFMLDSESRLRSAIHSSPHESTKHQAE